MKKLNKFGLGIVMMAATSMSLTSCIEETFPTDQTTSGEIENSSSSIEGLLHGITTYLSQPYFSYRYDWEFGYGTVMHVRDVQTQDLATADPHNYNQFWVWGENGGQGSGYLYPQVMWGYQFKFISNCNQVIGSINAESTDDLGKGYLAVAHAFRALMYLDMAREYEFLPNDKTQPVSPEGNDILNLTIPIVDENTTEEIARSNPRATREEMKDFILKDLKFAEDNIDNMPIAERTMPHLDVVYGLYARLYMWLEDYPKAEQYARKAIDASGLAPIDKASGMDPATGFNDITKWMLGSKVSKEALSSHLRNWTSFMACEAIFGYAGDGGCHIMLDKNMYDRLSNTDWRKLMFKAPAGHELDGKMKYIDEEYGKTFVDYTSTKFRPNGGEMEDFNIAAANAFPIMRVEEMYFIEAEAAAHQDVNRGLALLNEFMIQHRDSEYQTNKTAKEDVIEEIVFQKRIELWGEGQAFFDIKRMNYSCTRGYEGTNHLPNERFNTNGRAAWMNWCITIIEEEGNSKVAGYNNPDPSKTYTLWTGNQ